MMTIPPNGSDVKSQDTKPQKSRFKVANLSDPLSYIGASFLDDLEYREPFDLLSACATEEERTLPNTLESEWKKENVTHNEVYSVPRVMISNVELLLQGTTYSREVALASLIRHSLYKQERHCRLRRWWVSIRTGIINREQTFPRKQHFNMIYDMISSHRLDIPDFGSGRRTMKFRIPSTLQARMSKVSDQFGYSISQYSQYLIMRSLSECEGVQFKDEMRAQVIEIHTALEERIRLIVANIQALRIIPCKDLEVALSEVNLEDYLEAGEQTH